MWNADFVPCLFCYKRENVCTDVVAAKSVKIPVGLDGGGFRVVGVEVAVVCSSQVVRDDVSEKDRLYTIGFIIVSGFVEG